MDDAGSKAGFARTEESTDSERGSSGPTKKPSFARKLKTHLRKWWWAYLLVVIVCVLIIVLCVVYVGFPRIAQRDVNDSTLEITSLIISDPTPDSFHLVQESIVRSGSRYHPWLDAFNASLALAGAGTYGVLELPGLRSDVEVPVRAEQTIAITDAEAFAEYSTALLGSEVITQTVDGQTWLHEGSLPATLVTYSKSVQMKGFNKLDGFDITSFSIKTTPEDDGTNMVGTVYIPNPTAITVSMGNVTFDNYVDDKLVGNATLTDLVLKPGNNTVPMRAITDQLAVFDIVQAKYKDGKVPLEIRGRSVVYDGKHLPYLENALKSNTQHVTLNLLGGSGSR